MTSGPRRSAGGREQPLLELEALGRGLLDEVGAAPAASSGEPTSVSAPSGGSGASVSWP